MITWGVGETGSRVAVGIMVIDAVGKVVAIGTEVVRDEHEAKITVMRNAVMVTLVFIFRKSLQETVLLGYAAAV